jgi:hypothetical protein
MVTLSIIGMTGWVNPFWLTVRRPGTLSVLRRRSGGAFFCALGARFTSAKGGADAMIEARISSGIETCI